MKRAIPNFAVSMTMFLEPVHDAVARGMMDQAAALSLFDHDTAHVLAALKDHRRLGIHTEMFSDGVIDLVERGVLGRRHGIFCRSSINARRP